jgi:hypothetical protein
MTLHPKPMQPWYVAVLLPLPISDSVKLMSIALVIGGLASLMMNDVNPVILTAIVGYISILLLGRVFSVYRLHISDQEMFDITVELLNKTPSFRRIGESFCWETGKARANIFRNRHDVVCIEEVGEDWLVRGRRLYVSAIANALNARRIKV